MTQYGFFLDASSCTGCKACQAACKDKHSLPVGTLYRRVYEVSGGGWTREGQAWVSDVFAYNLSLACNHCAKPICVEVCPTDAYSKRADGIVLLDGDRCIGCQYCTWACPYGAPQYDPRTGITGKCTFCSDEIDAGRIPACVAACPLRALEFGEVSELQSRHGVAGAVFPLPSAALTQPALVVTPHRAAARATANNARISNIEEVGAVLAREKPLVIFTILAQMAVGAFWNLSALGVLNIDGATVSGSLLNLAAPALIAALMIVAILTSLAHLGRPARAWRAFANLRRSALSREVLFATIFAVGTGIDVLMAYFLPGTTIAREVGRGVTALAGLGLVYSMAQAYRLRTIPAWGSWTIPASFFATTLLLGGASTGLGLTLLPAEPGTWIYWFERGTAGWMALLFVIQLVILWRWLAGLTGSPAAIKAARRVRYVHKQMLSWRIGVVVAGIVVTLGTSVLPTAAGWMLCLALSLASETLGRVLFYDARVRHGV